MTMNHVVIDGSNIATEGREAPSLAQLDEAVQAFIDEYSPQIVTVVVDATFPNRIAAGERKAYEEAVAANELITPPAGAIGRGDGFVLQIARRAEASILSNDSFQEFHGQYPWLFEKGRLIGGKPVPHVGWVFMERAPVRGPTSRRAMSDARKEARAGKSTATGARAEATASPGAADDGAAPAPAKRSRRKVPGKAAIAAAAAAEAAGNGAAGDDDRAPEVADDAGAGAGTGAGSPRRRGKAAVVEKTGGEKPNDLLPFLEFVQAHPVGSEVLATIEKFSSHGAYAVVGDVRAYVPLRHLADPAPRSAKEVVALGEERSLVVVAIDPPRRGIDLGIPGVVSVEPVTAETTALVEEARAAAGVDEASSEAGAPAKTTRRSRKKAADDGDRRRATATRAGARQAHPQAGIRPCRGPRGRGGGRSGRGGPAGPGQAQPQAEGRPGRGRRGAGGHRLPRPPRPSPSRSCRSSAPAGGWRRRRRSRPRTPPPRRHPRPRRSTRPRPPHPPSDRGSGPRPPPRSRRPRPRRARPRPSSRPPR